MATMYCVKCRAKKDVANPQKVTMKNGKPAMKASCPDCGTTMFRIGAA
jgi:RNase P subunit RPR2